MVTTSVRPVVGEQTQESRWHAEQLTLTRKAHVEHVRTTTEDLALLVQPGQQRPVPRAPCPVPRVLGDLFHPAEQRNPGYLQHRTTGPGPLGVCQRAWCTSLSGDYF